MPVLDWSLVCSGLALWHEPWALVWLFVGAPMLAGADGLEFLTSSGLSYLAIDCQGQHHQGGKA